MTKFLSIVGAIAIIAIAIATVIGVSFLRAGVSTQREPSALEAVIARNLRHLAIPADARERTNPVPASAEVLESARAHWADHCAVCHAADGSGNTDIGRNLYPPAPDMRKDDTQDLSDGELFYIIRNGVRFTGMPGWGSGDPEEDRESWELVHFIRRLPALTDKEVAAIRELMPKEAHERAEEESAREFLLGGGAGNGHSHRHGEHKASEHHHGH